MHNSFPGLSPILMSERMSKEISFPSNLNFESEYQIRIQFPFIKFLYSYIELSDQLKFYFENISNLEFKFT
jgi:hypothetical protein